MRLIGWMASQQNNAHLARLMLIVWNLSIFQADLDLRGRSKKGKRGSACPLCCQLCVQGEEQARQTASAVCGWNLDQQAGPMR